NAGAEEVLALINSAGLDHRENEIARELALEINDVTFRRARLFGLRCEPFEFLLLADVGTEGDDLGGIGSLEPREDDRGIEPAGICQNDFHIAKANERGSGPDWKAEIGRRRLAAEVLEL